MVPSKAAVSCFISGRDYERSFGSLFCFGWEYVKYGACGCTELCAL